MAGQEVKPSAPLLARPLIPACAAGSELGRAAATATQTSADAFQPGSPAFWAAAFNRAGRAGAALAGLALLSAVFIAVAGVVATLRRRRRSGGGGSGLQHARQAWPGGLVLDTAPAQAARPPGPRPEKAALRTALRATAVLGGLTSLVASALGAARVSSLTASAVPSFWTGLALGWAAAVKAAGAGRAAVASLSDAAAGLDALAVALAATGNATAVLGAQAQQSLGDLPAMSKRAAAAAAEARSASVAGEAALSRLDGGDPSGKTAGALGAVSGFYDAWEARSASAAPRVRAGALAASLGLLALGSGVAAAVAAVDPARPGIPLVTAMAVCVLAAGAAAGGVAGVRTARAGARDACVFAETLVAGRVRDSAGTTSEVAARVARYYLDSPPADGDDASGLAPTPVATGAKGPGRPRPAPNVRLGGGRDAPAWARGGGAVPPPPPPSDVVTSFASSGRRLHAAPRPDVGLAAALGWDTSTLTAAAADPTTASLLALLASPSGASWVKAAPGLDAAGRDALLALPASVSATAAALDEFAAASDRSAFTPALTALKRLPCCTANDALGAWGAAWVSSGIGAAVVAAAAAGLGLWRGGRG